MDINRTTLLGRTTNEPETKQTSSGDKVSTFCVATNRTWKDANGETKEQADFHNIIAWKKLAEICEKYVKKGKRIYVEGRLSHRSWETEDGQKRYKTEIVAENIILLDKPPSSEPEPTYDGGGKYSTEVKTTEQKQISIEEIPF